MERDNNPESRMKSLIIFGLAISQCLLASASSLATAVTPSAVAQPVIIDTDIGSDLDDAFAIALVLRSPELKLIGVTTVSGDTVARAKIVDQMLGVTGHQDIPVAVGRATIISNGAPPVGRQRRFGDNGSFARAEHPDAVDFILAKIRALPDQITLMAIGPMTNLAAAFDKDPVTFKHVNRVVLMGGWIKPAIWGGMTYGVAPEYNIMQIPRQHSGSFAPACRYLSCHWTQLATCYWMRSSETLSSPPARH
jgi:purine nucleosidase